jgi:hypothetical protein
MRSKGMSRACFLVIVVFYLVLNCQAFFSPLHNCRFTRKYVSVDEGIIVQKSTVSDAATLKVPAAAWRWPPAWPFSEDSFEEIDDEYSSSKELELAPKFEQFFSSISSSLGSKVLVIGGSESSIEKFKSYGWETIPDINNIPSNLPNEFDSIIVLNGVDKQKDPRKAFSEVWSLLKPSGACYSCFIGGTGNGASKPIKLWTTTTDDQKMWVAGSYCYYAAPEGWKTIEGFDITGGSGDKQMVFTFTDGNNILPYLVCGRKVEFDGLDLSKNIDELAKDVQLRFSRLYYLDSLERKLLAFRASNDLQRPEQTRNAEMFVESKLRKLQEIYAILKG